MGKPEKENECIGVSKLGKANYTKIFLMVPETQWHCILERRLENEQNEQSE